MSQPSGWYDDPQNPANLRYWDGVLWTDHTTPKQAPAPDPQHLAQPPGAYAGPPAYGPSGYGTPGQGPTGYGPPSGTGVPSDYGAPPPSYGYGAAPPLSTWAPMGRITSDGRPLAEPWQRLLAAILDSIILGLVTTLVTFPLWRDFITAYVRLITTIADNPSAPPPTMTEMSALVQDSLGPKILWITLLALGLSLLYNTVFLVRSGATPGKLALGIRVRRSNRPGPLTIGEALRRQVLDLGIQLLGAVPIISLVTPMLSIIDKLWLLWDPRRQTLHDKVADTVVEQKPKPGMP